MFYQKKPCLHLELSSKVPSKENILKQKEDPGIHCWWDNNQGGIRIHLAMDYYRTKKQGNSRTNYLKGKKHADSRKVSLRFGQDSWKTIYIYRWGTWYPMACRFLKLKHHFHSSLEKSLIKRTIQHIKDRTECFDDYFPCSKEKCKLNHVKNWLNLFVKIHNKEVLNAQVNSAWHYIESHFLQG